MSPGCGRLGRILTGAWEACMLCRRAEAAVVAVMQCACVPGVDHKLAQVVHLGVAHVF